MAKKIRLGQRGAAELARAHGEYLLCMRSRGNVDGTEKLTFIELVVERVVIQKRGYPVQSFKIKPEEVELWRVTQDKGATHDGKSTRGCWRAVM